MPDTQHIPGDLMSGGTGMSMRRFKTEQTLPGGDAEWGSAPGWVGFRRPTQNLAGSQMVTMQAPEVGFHAQRVYTDPNGEGSAISLMGDPVQGGHMFPTDPNAGYEFQAGRP